MTDRKCFVFKFADVEVREREFLLTRAGESLAVEPKAFRVLLFLLQNPGRLVTKDEIVASVWNDSAVSDNSLTRSIAQLRRVLGDDSRQPLYILTVPTVGYRFLCEVTATEDGFVTSPRLENGATPNGRPRDYYATPAPATPALESQELLPVLGNHASAPPRRKPLAGIAASLLVLIAAALIWRAVGKNPTRDRHAPTYPLLEQRVTSNPGEDPIEGAVISPDGKYLAYKDPTGLYLRELSTGETRPWSLPQGFIARPTSWFPDSTHLLVVRIEGQPQVPDLERFSIYKLSLLGGAPQKIMDNAAAGSVSPDGSRIAYLPGSNFGSELWLMNADGSNARELTFAGVLDKPGSHGSWIWRPAWSPDGHHIAYIEALGGFGSDPNAKTASVMTIDANGSGLNEALNDSHVGQALSWAPDGRVLLAWREDRFGAGENYGIYGIQLDHQTGKATGPPQPVTQAEGSIGGLNTTADGKRLVLWRTKEPLQVFIAGFNARTRQFEQPRRLTLDEDFDYASAWTADSKAVLYASNRQGTLRLFKQQIDQTTPEALVEARSIVLPRLSPDGSEVLYLTTSTPGATSGRVALMAKPLAGGPPRLVLTDEGIVNYGCPRAPSQQCVLSRISGQDLVFVAFDTKSGAGRNLAVRTASDIENWVLSPDGSKLAIVLDHRRLRFLSLDKDVVHDVTVKDWPLYAVDWSADGRTVFMPSVTQDGTPVILEVDQAGRARVALQGTANNIAFSAMIQSPDGQYGLLLEKVPAENNVWMVDNF